MGVGVGVSVHLYVPSFMTQDVANCTVACLGFSPSPGCSGALSLSVHGELPNYHIYYFAPAQWGTLGPAVVRAPDNGLFKGQRFCEPVDHMLVAWNWPWWKYLPNRTGALGKAGFPSPRAAC